MDEILPTKSESADIVVKQKTTERPAPAVRYRHVSVSKSRHGKTVIYFRKGKGGRVRLPDDMHSTAFRAAYWSLMDGGYETAMPMDAREAQIFLPRIDSMIGSAKTRAASKNVAFTVTKDWIYKKLLEQNCRCAITGLKFTAKKDIGSLRNPYGMSLDRIIPSLGYTEENCRIVLYAVNVMMMDWGLEAVAPIARHVADYADKKSK